MSKLEQGQIACGNANRWHRPRLRDVENWLYRALSTEWCGNNCVPCEDLTLRWNDNGCERVGMVLDDAFELGIGTPDAWYVMIRRESARRLAWFILWDWWICGEWFGLRRAIWYWLLHRRCERSNRIGKALMECEAATPADPPKEKPEGTAEGAK